MSSRWLENEGSGVPNSSPTLSTTTSESKYENDIFEMFGESFNIYSNLTALSINEPSNFECFNLEEEAYTDLSKVVEVELQRDSVFAFNSMEYAHIFSDIRFERELDEYEDINNRFVNEIDDRDQPSPLLLEQGLVAGNETRLLQSSPSKKIPEKLIVKEKSLANNVSPGGASPTQENDRKQSEGLSPKNRLAATDDLTGKVVALSKDQNGCRYLQTLLEGQSAEYLNLITTEVINNASELMVDPFGNYLCQKIIDRCTEEQRSHLIIQVTDHLEEISSNNHGTRAVQKLLDAIVGPVQIQMIANALKGHVVNLITDLNGNHVIQRFLHKFSPVDCQFIYVDVIANLVHVATQRYGCCVLQRCVDHANPVQRKCLVEQIGENALQLVQDQFGNYVVQYALDSCPPTEHSVIVSKFVGSVTQLSTQKFSSNVMEKCLEIAEPHIQRQFLKEICNDKNVQILLSDPFGNYVLQRALNLSDDELFNSLCSKIRPLLPALRSTACGKRICNKLFKVFPTFADGVGVGVNIGSPVGNSGYSYPSSQFPQKQEVSVHQSRYNDTNYSSPVVGIHGYSVFSTGNSQYM